MMVEMAIQLDATDLPDESPDDGTSNFYVGCSEADSIARAYNRYYKMAAELHFRADEYYFLGYWAAGSVMRKLCNPVVEER